MIKVEDQSSSTRSDRRVTRTTATYCWISLKNFVSFLLQKVRYKTVGGGGGGGGGGGSTVTVL